MGRQVVEETRYRMAVGTWISCLGLQDGRAQVVKVKVVGTFIAHSDVQHFTKTTLCMEPSLIQLGSGLQTSFEDCVVVP